MLKFISYIMSSVQYSVKDKLIQTFSSIISNLLKHTIRRAEHARAETRYKPHCTKVAWGEAVEWDI